MTQCRYLRVSRHFHAKDTWKCIKGEAYTSQLKCSPHDKDRPSICMSYIGAVKK